jgi:hypothetical protein
MRIRSRAHAALAATALAVLVPALCAAPASAATDRVTDETQDVTAFVSEDDQANPDSTADSGTADIRSARVSHGRTVVFSAVVDDIKRDDDMGIWGVVRTPSGARYVVRAFRPFGEDTPPPAVFKNGRETLCGARSLSATFDVARDVATLRVARSCLDGPASFRWGVSVASFPEDGSVRADDARRDGNAPGDPRNTRVGGNVRFG